jgi:hypothetical protein
MKRSPPAPAAAPAPKPAAHPIAREGGSYIVGKDGKLLREEPTHENGGGRALTDAERRAVDAAKEA